MSNEIVEKVAAGLRRMNKTPDAFMFIDDFIGEDWTWDLPVILGIPVYHCAWINNTVSGYAEDCPFYPLFKTEETEITLYTDFCRGYSEGF